MDDKNFSVKDAKIWISTIESSPESKRDIDIYPLINEWLKKTKAINVLDLGCGQGACLQKLDLREIDYQGTDPSEFLTHRAQELNPKFKNNFRTGNAYKLPFSDNTFDACFSLAVFHLLEDIEKALSEVKRILKPNGHFLIVTANPKSLTTWQNAYDSFDMKDSKLTGKSTTGVTEDVLYMRSKEELTSKLKSNGFKINRTQDIRIWLAIDGVKNE